MAGQLFPLSPFPEELEAQQDYLPPIFASFFIPRLSDKPQDPILDALKLADELARKPPILFDHQAAASLFQNEALAARSDIESDDGARIWRLAVATKDTRAQNNIRSWDALRSVYPASALPSSFLSEQKSRTFAAARYYVNPPLHDPSIRTIYVTREQMLHSLKLVMIGSSSPLWVWDEDSETFVLWNEDSTVSCVLAEDGKDETITTSFTTRFLNIGTLLRRIESLIVKLRLRLNDGPAIHAFTHSVSACIDYLRLNLSELPGAFETSMQPSAIWMDLALPEHMLEAIAALSFHDDEPMLATYTRIPTDPATLLSRIYSHLQMHIDRQSPRQVTAMLAYVLTETSETYFKSLSESVGYCSGPFALQTQNLLPSDDQIADAETLDEEDDISADAQDVVHPFPNFMLPEVIESLVRAKRSLKLLHAADPDHPLLKQTSSGRQISWIWTPAEVDFAWHESRASVHTEIPKLSGAADAPTGHRPTSDNPNTILDQFKVFDLEPGVHLGTISSFDPTSKLRSFIDKFPSSLPPLTPTLPLLTDLVLHPLFQHCHAISHALLSVFLSPQSHLNVHAHLRLLRGFLLLTSPSFKSRLQSAIFSDSEDWTFEQNHARALAQRSRSRSRTRSRSGESGTQHNATWAVGLGLGVVERDSWPPGGADLSFYLRTVIVDALESRLVESFEEGVQDSVDRVHAEAEFRLGFAIRDLPVGTGRDRWLNPCSIESLDFLYMDYKPPHPLDVVITPDVLSKYNRVFCFSLRLLRVQNALSAVFRMTRKPTEPLFPTITPSNKRLLHFRFLAQHFVTALTSYVFDTAIGGNFDAFLARIGDGQRHCADVFALAELHSATLDDILAACLLRSTQRAVGDALRVCLELVLDLCILAGELRRERIEEYRAAPVLEELFAAFREKMAHLIKVLRALVDKGVSTSHLPFEFAYLGGSGSQLAMGGAGSLHHLLVKLDSGGWWESYSQQPS